MAHNGSARAVSNRCGHGVSLSEQNGQNNVSFTSETLCVDMRFIPAGVFNVSPSVGQAGHPERRDGRELGGDSGRRVDD